VFIISTKFLVSKILRFEHTLYLCVFSLEIKNCDHFILQFSLSGCIYLIIHLYSSVHNMYKKFWVPNFFVIQTQIEYLYACCSMTGEEQKPFTACTFVQKAYCESLGGEWENSYFCERIKFKYFILINCVTLPWNFFNVWRCGLGYHFTVWKIQCSLIWYYKCIITINNCDILQCFTLHFSIQ